MLTLEHRRLLLSVARGAITAQVEGSWFDVGEPGNLPNSSGVFVTIRIRGELRGCLGTLQSNGDLWLEVARCAADAASEDPRFPRIAREELPELSVEISVLGPLEGVDPSDPDAIQVGVHGLVVERGRRRGLLLPQVATEWAWTREQFLRQTCVKAELPPDSWRHGAAVFRFTAEVFRD